jgi:hypothetical protein
MYGLVTAASIGENYALWQDWNYTTLCMQIILSYAASGFVLNCIIELTWQGGYCIVGGEVESVFHDQTCNTDCDDVNIPCSVCDIAETHCFIQFWVPEWMASESVLLCSRIQFWYKKHLVGWLVQDASSVRGNVCEKHGTTWCGTSCRA